MGNVLRLGDPDTWPHEGVEVLIKTSKCTAIANPPSLKKFAKRAKNDEDMDAMDEDEDKRDVYAELQLRTEHYLRHDEEEEDKRGTSDDEEEEVEEEEEEKGQRVDKEELIRGFRYGTSYAPCPEGEFPRMSTKKGLDICGFFPDSNVRHRSLC